MNDTVFAQAWAMTESRLNQVRTYWRIESAALMGAGIALVFASSLGVIKSVPLAHGFVAICLAAMGAYIGFVKHVPDHARVTATRVFGALAFVTLAAALMGYLPMLAAAELTTIAAVGAVALYVGFTPA